MNGLFFSRSSLKVPSSTISPSLKTRIWEKLWRVYSWWVMFSVAFPFIMISRHYWTLASFYLSRADVASSNRRIVGSSSIALAIATLCFCPPERWEPRGPTFRSKKCLASLSSKDSAFSPSLAFNAAENNLYLSILFRL